MSYLLSYVRFYFLYKSIVVPHKSRKVDVIEVSISEFLYVIMDCDPLYLLPSADRKHRGNHFYAVQIR